MRCPRADWGIVRRCIVGPVGLWEVSPLEGNTLVPCFPMLYLSGIQEVVAERGFVFGGTKEISRAAPPLPPPVPPPGNGSRSSVSFGWRRTGNTRSDVKRKCGPSAPPGTLWSAIPSHGVWYRYRARHEGARGPARYLCRGVGEAGPARDLLCRACMGCLLHISLPLPRHVDAEIAYSSI